VLFIKATGYRTEVYRSEILMLYMGLPGCTSSSCLWESVHGSNVVISATAAKRNIFPGLADLSCTDPNGIEANLFER
jgi:hypothetical protein